MGRERERERGGEGEREYLYKCTFVYVCRTLMHIHVQLPVHCKSKPFVFLSALSLTSLLSLSLLLDSVSLSLYFKLFLSLGLIPNMALWRSRLPPLSVLLGLGGEKGVGWGRDETYVGEEREAERGNEAGLIVHVHYHTFFYVSDSVLQ